MYAFVMVMLDKNGMMFCTIHVPWQAMVLTSDGTWMVQQCMPLLSSRLCTNQEHAQVVTTALRPSASGSVEVNMLTARLQGGACVHCEVAGACTCSGTLLLAGGVLRRNTRWAAPLPIASWTREG
jgi:hypothetical protein